MKKLVINRSKWMRGNPTESSLLLSDGKMCCLGFLSKAEGLSDDELLNRGTPQWALSQTIRFGTKFDKAPDGMKFLLRQGTESYSNYAVDNSRVCYKLMETNDDPTLDDAKREAKLKFLFAENGWDVEFVDSEDNNVPVSPVKG